MTGGNSCQFSITAGEYGPASGAREACGAMNGKTEGMFCTLGRIGLIFRRTSSLHVVSLHEWPVLLDT